ncbi:MAG: hypothetical protein M3457_06950 [Chloroflexota bacterium]|nr:hypothetical protein [Chloroflexota bacterium]
MQAFAFNPETSIDTPESLIGAIVTHAVRVPGGSRLRKGQVIAASDIATLARLDAAIHLVRLDEGDVHEDEAGRRLAGLIAGSGLTVRDPVQSRVNVIAAHKGLLRVDAGTVQAINRLPPVGVFTVLDRLPVVPGKIVAGAKIATVAMPEYILDEIGALIADRGQPVLEVKPYLPHRVGVVVTEGLAGKLRDRFEASVRAKVAWYGSELIRFDYVANDPEAAAAAISDLRSDGANLVLTAGGNMMDPLDASILAMPEIGASIVRLGAPAHPGSMFWLAEIADGSIPIVNLASCSMYSKATVADLVLPWVMAGETVTAGDLASLGYGGLLDRDMGWRFPTYNLDTVDEPDET